MSAWDAAPWLGQVLQHVEFQADYDEDDRRRVVTGIEHANVVTSAMIDRTRRGPFAEALDHRPVLDIDVPAVLIPSSTPGHSHLYIDRPMSWETYCRLLLALADAGIIEHGYAGASIARGATAVRLPWVRK